MNYKLYYATGSAAMGVRVLLEEIGESYELIETPIDMSVPRTSDHLALNPNGWVPVLVWEDRAMYECAAITIYLCDLYPEAGLSPDIRDPKRALYLQTLTYFSNAVQTSFQQTYYPQRFADTATNEADAEKRGVKRLRETFGVIDQQIAENEWILGDQFSAADIYLYMLTTWLSDAKNHPKVDEFKNINRIINKVAERPSVRKVYNI